MSCPELPCRRSLVGPRRSRHRSRATGRYCHRPVEALPTRPFLIGVAGGSSSGKTTVAERLAELRRRRGPGADQARLLLRRSQRPAARRAGDVRLRPSRRVRLAAAQRSPRRARGRARRCRSPSTTTSQYNRSGDVRIVRPAGIVVVEGILVLWEPTLRERFDLKVFVDTDADIRLIRRIRRDAAERGRIDRERHRAVPDDGPTGPRAVHRTEQALRRRDHPPGWAQPPGPRRPARSGA